MSEQPKLEHIFGPKPINLERVEKLVEAYRTGKVQGLVMATGTEDGSMDALFVDSPQDCHTTRTLFTSCHMMAHHLLRKLG
jgi:hypothetical protein